MVTVAPAKKRPTGPASEPRAPAGGWLVPLVALLVFIYPRHDWVHYRNLNETTRIYLTRAMVDERTLNIDHQIQLDGDTHDKAEYAGHFYCDKPIGLSLLAVPVYAVLKVIGAATGHAWTLAELRYIFTIICISIPSVLAIKWLRGYWAELTRDSLLADFAVLAYALGTIAFTYSTQFMGHQIAAVLAVAHFAVARHIRRDPATGIRWFLLAGLLTGFGTITEYFTIFLHAIIFAGYARRMPFPRAWGIWLAAAAVGVCPLLIYNAMAFGGPFTMGYAHEATGAFQAVHGTGFLGVTHPRGESLWGLLFSATKGLFFLSPFLLLFILGAARWREKPLRLEVSIHLAATLVIIYLATSLAEWPAGNTIGPRHMVSMLPFMMSLVVLAVARWRFLTPLFAAFGIMSMLLIAVGTLTVPAFEASLENPLRTQALFLLDHGQVSPNPLTACGVRGVWSLLPVAMLVVGVMVVLTRRAHRAARRIFSPSVIVASLIAAGWSASVFLYEPEQHPALRTLLQGYVLWWTGDLNESAVYYEKSLDMLESIGTPETRQIAVERVIPTLMAIYQETNNLAAASRLAAHVGHL